MPELDFPYRVSRLGRTATTEGVDHVRDLIEQVLLTAPGERVMRPDFGAGLLALVFEPNGTVLGATAEMLVSSALQLHLSHLIAVLGVEVANDDTALRVEVHFALLSDRTTHTASLSLPGAEP